MLHFQISVRFQVSKPDMWLQTALILIQYIMLFAVTFSNEYITDENLTRWKN